jgi:hypothetical protein
MYSSIADGFTKIKTSDGVRGLTLGWSPTLIGYSL